MLSTILSVLRDPVPYRGGLGIFAIVTLELAYVTYSPILYLFVPESYVCAAPPGDNIS